MSTNNFLSLNIKNFNSFFSYSITILFISHKKLKFYYLNSVHQKYNFPSFHTPKIPSTSYKVKKCQSFELRFVPSYVTHQKKKPSRNFNFGQN